DEDVPLFVEGDVGGVDELARPGAQAAPLAEQLAAGGVDHHALVVGVGDIDVAVGADADAGGPAVDRLGHGPLAQVLPVVVDVLDAGEPIDDPETVVRFRIVDGAGVGDLTRTGTGAQPDVFGRAALPATGKCC